MYKNHKSFEITTAFTTILQSSLIVIVSVGLCIAGANFLIDHFELGDSTMLFAIILGVLSGMFGMFKYLYRTIEVYNFNGKRW